MNMCFPGTFNPFTIGHAHIVKRALDDVLCESITILFAVNKNKDNTDNKEEFYRVARLYVDNPKVIVALTYGTVGDFAKDNNIDVFVRGCRNAEDFKYESNLSIVNKEIYGIDTVFFITDPKYSWVSSSVVREMIANGVDASKLIYNGNNLE